MQSPPPRRPSGDNNGDNNKPPNIFPPRFQLPSWVWVALLLLIIGWTFINLPGAVNNVINGEPINIPYSVFFDQIIADNITEVTISETEASGQFATEVTWPPDGSALLDAGVEQKTSKRFVTELLPIEDSDLPATLREHNVTIVAENAGQSTILSLLFGFGPILLLLGFFLWSARRTQAQIGSQFGFGRSQAREYDAQMPGVTFDDVAGQEPAKNELVEIVDFLREPDKYISLGARIPRGVLLSGPPGTGKTLLARAVAGEANAAFYSITASEFVEMFVGVGASRVRDLFKRAKSAAPSIIFIDEIDAVGRQRGAGLGGGNDEREQTLNQMLAEMDGFDQSESVIVIAATNRPDVLDPALLRPGRFDRQVTLALPDRAGREAILKIHTRGKPLASDVDFSELAQATIGFSGADIANLANEAALSAARNNRKQITGLDFAEAFDRIVLGTESPPLADPREREVVAYHEAGHALVAALTPHSDPVLKVTIVPRGQALGVTAQLPSDDRRNYSREYLEARMNVLLGGRTAEEIIFDSITTGAENDLRQVTSLARRMVAQWGMTDEIGPLNFGDDDRQPFLGYSLSQGRQYSEETAARIDTEVRRLVEEAHVKTRALLTENRDKLEQLAHELLEHEIVEKKRVLEIAGKVDVTNENPSTKTEPA
ncbi:MAG: ATP-dependent metallopeptidase FtsH/Yme1/Tma family protein [Chloroflexi bacterium]|nr:MAG: cell division protein FtsH [Phototrophicales bacterium]RMF79728.1 MAG: ATP-dependent metallopeptidase FtsH/Yme1/Tma family protein [Chloroflexota bacterium]